MSLNSAEDLKIKIEKTIFFCFFLKERTLTFFASFQFFHIWKNGWKKYLKILFLFSRSKKSGLRSGSESAFVFKTLDIRIGVRMKWMQIRNPGLMHGFILLYRRKCKLNLKDLIYNALNSNAVFIFTTGKIPVAVFVICPPPPFRHLAKSVAIPYDFVRIRILIF